MSDGVARAIFLGFLNENADELGDDRDDTTPDPFAKIFEASRLAASLGGADRHERVAGLTAQAEDIDRTFQRLPGHAATSTTSSHGATLEKRARGSRTEKTHYPATGIVVCAELDENNHVVRVYQENEA
jgi:hypothetical protein